MNDKSNGELTQIKRVNYYEGQPLTVDDFRDEQDYHIQMRRLHNRSLHTWGVGLGLEVNQIDSRQVEINPGMAVDKFGREIILFEKMTIDAVSLAKAETGEFYLTISYEAKESNVETTSKCQTDATRILEKPRIEMSSNRFTDGSKISLAKITIADCIITEVDDAIRLISGIIIPGCVRKDGGTMIGPLSLKGPDNFKESNFLAFEGDAGKERKWFRWVHDTEKNLLKMISKSDDDKAAPLSIMTFIRDSGWVGIGTEDPKKPLVIQGSGQSQELLGFENSESKALKWHVNLNLNAAPKPGFNIAETGVADGRLFIQEGGKVGIGTIDPQAKLHVPEGAILNWLAIGVDPPGAINFPFPYETVGTINPGHNLRLHSNLSIFFHVNNESEPGMGIARNHDVTIRGRLGTNGFPPEPKTEGWGGGIHTWDIEAEGTVWSHKGLQSGPRDLAENYLSDSELEAGDVVCLDKKKDRMVMSDKPNDGLVLGVISTAPGFLLNVDHSLKDAKVFPVALCGRVPCKVVDENGSIKRGDFLTTSSTPGHAMKASPIKINDEEFYRPGTIIGKALGSLQSGEGVIDIMIILM